MGATGIHAVDLLVLGAGMAGLSAAAWGVRQSASVVLVERGEVGGSARMSGGTVWTVQDEGELSDHMPDSRLARALYGDFESIFDWFRSVGVVPVMEKDVLRYGRGRLISIQDYLRICEKMVRDDPASELLVGPDTRELILEDGAVRGARLVDVDGNQIEIRAGATVLATGGFQNDPDLRAELIHPNARHMPVRGNHQSRGTGLRLALAAGAQVSRPDAGFYGHLLPSEVSFSEQDDYRSLTLFFSEHAILVNLEGRRFVDETHGDHLNAIALLKQPGARGLLIADARVYEQWIIPPYAANMPSIDRFDYVFKRGARCAVAGDLDEILDMPPEWGYDGAVVRQAVLDFNRQCARGSLDPTRRFDAAPIDRPPYYLVEAVPAITFTFTGPMIDDQARVLDKEGKPIDGLYAAGGDAGGVYYNGYAGGLSSATVFGLRAARSALEGRR
jgi:succinate dehydrogenase/fumarate reductase flavoprotein subunit